MDILMILRTLADRVAAWTLIGLGVLALLLGYLGVRGTAYVAEQVPYIISGGIFGLFLLGLGAVLLLSADLRDQWRALLDIRDRMAEETDPAGSPSSAPPTPSPIVAAAAARRPERVARRGMQEAR